MTKARDLYVKINAELDRATNERDDLRSRLDAELAVSASSTDRLSVLARTLLPEAAKLLTERFGGYLGEAESARADLATASASLREAEERAKALDQAYALATQEYGEVAETRRRAMIGSQEYIAAVQGLSKADARLKASDLSLKLAEQKLSRLTELARQNTLHGMLLPGDEKAPGGHFVLSLMNVARDRIRSTQWFMRTDADRREADEEVVERRSASTVAKDEAERHRHVIEGKRAEYEQALKPENAELQGKKEASEAARLGLEKARSRMRIAEGRSREVRNLSSPQAKAALADLASLLARSTTAGGQDKADIDAIRATPDGASTILKASEISAEIAKTRLSTIDIREALETAEGVIDELDKVRRKMKRSGMSGSSRTVQDVDSFMASGGTDGFDMTTFVVLAAVSDSVTDASPSSSSDWSSSSSSSFD